MTPADRTDLAERVDRALKSLPAPPAPPAFAAGVMRRVIDSETRTKTETETAVSTVRGPFEWPAALKVAFASAGFAFIVAGVLLWPAVAGRLGEALQSPSIILARTALDTARPLVAPALIYITAMCVACAAAASLLKHIALGGASNS